MFRLFEQVNKLHTRHLFFCDRTLMQAVLFTFTLMYISHGKYYFHFVVICCFYIGYVVYCDTLYALECEEPLYLRALMILVLFLQVNHNLAKIFN